jgi:hypothetical protein
MANFSYFSTFAHTRQFVQSCAVYLSLLCLSISGVASAEPLSLPVASEDLTLDRETIESSPVLQRWLADPPDILYDIYNTPSFNTKLRLGITSRDNSLGFDLGVEDAFIGKTPLALSGSYQQEFSGRESSWDANLRYYLFPLGSYYNVAPQVGYRQLNLFEQPNTSGLDLGIQGIIVLSPRSADLKLSHTFTNPGGNNETSITSISTSYAITRNWRLGSNIQWRRSPVRNDSRVGFVLEWAL